MKSWQKNHLVKNRCSLLQSTICNEQLLARLESGGELSSVDIVSIRCKDNQLERCRLLYDIVETRINGFWLLALGLAECMQTASFDILMEGFAQHLYSQYSEKSVNTRDAMKVIVNIKNHLTPLEYKNLCEQHQPLNLDEMNLIKNTIPEQPQFYIPRTLSKRVTINQKLFTIECPDIFVFKNIGRHQLTELVKPQGTASSTSQIDDGLTYRFICLDEDVDWDDLCEAAEYVPIHLIKYEADKNLCILKKTVGNSTVLFQYLDRSSGSEVNEFSSSIDENEFLEKVTSKNSKSSGYCICDSPGMGKTFLVENLARQFAQRWPDKIVAVIKLSEFMNKIDQIPWGQVKVEKVILEYLSTSHLAENILKELYKAEMLHFELFFDGLDEVAPSQASQVLEVLKDITKKLQNTRIFVTSRPHLRYELECCLNAVSYDILSFNKQNKVDFLVSVWTQLKVSADQSKLSQFASYCLDKFKSNNAKDAEDITGIPLQCRLLAEVLAQKAKRFARSRRNIPVEDTCKLDNSLPQLYKEYIQLSFEKSTVQWNFPSDVQEIRNYHIWIALKTVLPETSNVFAKNFSVNTEKPDVKMFSVGLLKKVFKEDSHNESVEFVHRTFAEYLIADFFTNLLEDFSCTESLRKQLLHGAMLGKVLLTRKIPESVYFHYPDLFLYPAVAYFLNFTLGKISFDQNPNISVVFSHLSNMYSVKRFYPLLFASLNQNYTNIFHLVTSALTLLKQKSKLRMKLPPPSRELAMRLLFAATKQLSVSTMDKLSFFFANHFGYNISNESAICCSGALTLVLQKGDYEMTQYFANKSLTIDGSFIFNCISKSNDDPMAVVEAKLNICRLLVSKQKDILKTGNSSLLFFKRVHLMHLKWLISQGLNPCLAYDNLTIVHLAAGYMNNADFHELCSFLIEDRKEHVIFAKSELLRYILVKRKTTSMLTITLIRNVLKTHGNILSENAVNFALLAFATKQSKNIFEVLFNHNADNNCQQQEFLAQPQKTDNVNNIFCYLPFLSIDTGPLDDMGNTFLHIAAKNYGPDEYHQIVNHLVCHGNANIFKTENKNLELSVHVAMESMEILESTLRVFQRCEVDLNSVSNDGSSLLMYAVRGRRSVNLLKILIEVVGVDVYLKDWEGRTFAHAISKQYSAAEYHDIVKFVIEKKHGDAFRVQTCLGRTPLHEAVLRTTELFPETIRLLVANNCVDLNAADIYGESIIQWVVKQKQSLELVKELVRYGADWNVVTKHNTTLAHRAASYGLLEHLKYFVELGCDINRIDNDGDNALQCAIYDATENVMEMARFLIEKGVNRGNVNKSGKNAYMMAVEKGLKGTRILHPIQKRMGKLPT